ncbi:MULTISPECIES: hypothetical protein [unclassified Yoonia]|uniref:hypothetical protein n=1 Tax=unclassified Yoonia TaxID=2629118 RepID=UPI002AFFA527|nr:MULTISPECIES: hypothetical protein [unclassified Yoonia]
MSKRETLIARANELELTFAKNINNKNLEALIATAEADKNTSAGPSGGEDNGGEIGDPTGDANDGGPEGLTPASFDAAGETTAVQQGAAPDTTQEAGAAPADTAAMETGVQDPTPTVADMAGEALPAANGETFTIPATVVEVPKPDIAQVELTVVVTGPKKGRRRAGYQFGAEPVRIPAGELSLEQAQALETDPTLTVAYYLGDEKVDVPPVLSTP